MNSNNLFHSYLLHLADSALILAQRNGEWCGHGPVLEQDIAITNITLDLVGQARNFYQYAAQKINEETGAAENEDTLAYHRGERDFKNLLLCELPKGDWAHTILRQFLFSCFQQLQYEQLLTAGDEQLKAIAEKSLKEIHYHVKWSSEWVIRLGDGTDESHQRMLSAIAEIWPYSGEMFINADYELFDVASLQNKWHQMVQAVMDEATLPLPEKVFMYSGGKLGMHTEHMGYILAEMQSLQRTYPNAEW